MSIEKLSWLDARDFMVKLQPELAAIIDHMPIDENHFFYKMRYRYGDPIIDSGSLRLPHCNEQTPFGSDDAKAEILRELDYSSVPTMLLLSKGAEVYTEPDQRVSPLAVLKTGYMPGLWETLDPGSNIFVSKSWSISAGARSIFFLPKITNQLHHDRLVRKLKVNERLVSSPYQQWHLFKKLVNTVAPDDWFCDILVFSKGWFLSQKDGSAWDAFRFKLLSAAWEQTQIWRKKMYSEITWETFLSALAKRNIKTSQNELYIAQHLIEIAYGLYPGLRPAVDDEFAPIHLIQKIYVENYGLDQYAPVIFTPYHRDPKLPDSKPIYFSLGSPTNMHYSINERQIPVNIDILRNIIRLNDLIQEKELLAPESIVKTTNPIQYRYFHRTACPRDRILAAREMVDYDPELEMIMARYPDRVFPNHCHFVNGCITVTHPLQE